MKIKSRLLKKPKPRTILLRIINFKIFGSIGEALQFIIFYTFCATIIADYSLNLLLFLINNWLKRLLAK